MASSDRPAPDRGVADLGHQAAAPHRPGCGHKVAVRPSSVDADAQFIRVLMTPGLAPPPVPSRASRRHEFPTQL